MRKQTLLLFCAVVFLDGSFSGCSRGDAEPSRSEFVLGTVCTITLYDQGYSRVYRDIFRRLREIEDRMSVNIAESDIARINAAAGQEPVKAHDDVFEVIRRALYYAEISDGAFDPTVGPLVSLWGIGGDNPRVPSTEEINAALGLINRHDVVLNRENSSVFLKRPGMALDLGAIAKGYAADEAAAILKKAKIKQAIVNLGGNILTHGEKKDKSPWRIGIQDPSGQRGAYIGYLQEREKTVVTSGLYERYFESGGEHYHHILSPADGYPARNNLLSVSIVTNTSMNADALSTSVFVLGYEKGKALIESLEDVQAIFIFDDLSIHIAGGLDFV
ncbi:MAG: FAD:protein FMN transferase, partial [Treponema sp.]|nr:FAD:protein FMN transferase [Treponema sp.]